MILKSMQTNQTTEPIFGTVKYLSPEIVANYNSNKNKF